jgi:DHA2 family multidrug resistance protein
MGPQLAGSLDAWAVARYGWTAILWASLLPGAVALLAGAAGLWREKIRWRIFIHADLAGLIALCAGLVLLAVGVSQGNRLHWSDSPAILALLAGGAACLGLFALHERRHLRHPAVSLRLARRWNFTLGALATLPLQLASACSGALVPELLARLQGFRPEQIAPVLTAALWPQLLAYPFGVLALRYRLADARTLLVLGLCCVALGCVCDLSVTSDWMAADFAAGQWLQGLGLPLIILPLLVLFVGEVIPSEGVYAASIFNVSRSLAGTAVGAWMATSLRLGGQAKYADLLANTGLYPLGHRGALAATAAVVAHAGADPGQTHLRAVRLIAIAARRQAAVLAGSAMFADLAAALFVSCCLALLMAGFGHGHPDRRKAGR